MTNKSSIYLKAAQELPADQIRFTCNEIFHWSDMRGVSSFGRESPLNQYARLFSPVDERAIYSTDIGEAVDFKYHGGMILAEQTFRFMLLLNAWQEALAHGE